jgi:nitrate reductase NapE component
MFAAMMKTFDRFALSYFLALAITPMLAVAAAGAIH